jgi:demethylmenaquinone methyltransferase / 2-methoxy-6-polyprenyl-1,4-benzoquinol methylase
MSHLTGNERSRYVQTMFANIAQRYDLMNRLMTGGMDVRWRKFVIRQAAVQAGQRLLDLGAGTGDLAREAQRQSPGVQVIAADFTLEMMRVGRHHDTRNPLSWLGADALRLPFPPQTFDAVVSGFLLRNVADLPRALQEQQRVLKPGGRIVILDTTRPSRHLLTPFMQFYLHRFIPLMGRWIAGHSEAYTYLPDSTEAFLSAEQLAAQLQAAGFSGASFQRLLFGAVAIHWAIKT